MNNFEVIDVKIPIVIFGTIGTASYRVLPGNYDNKGKQCKFDMEYFKVQNFLLQKHK